MLVANRLHLSTSRRLWHKGARLRMWLRRAHARIESTERHHSPGRSVMEAATLDTTHIDIALIHKGLHEQRERLAIRPERRVGADMRPERLNEFEATTYVRHNIW